MKKKDEVFSKFVEFKALVENDTGKKIELIIDEIMYLMPSNNYVPRRVLEGS